MIVKLYQDLSTFCYKRKSVTWERVDLHISPVLDRVPSALTIDQVSQVNHAQELIQLLVGEAFGSSLRLGIRVCDLVSESAQGQVWLLGNIEQLGRMGLGHRTAYVEVSIIIVRFAVCPKDRLVRRCSCLPNKGHKSPRIRKRELLPCFSAR